MSRWKIRITTAAGAERWWHKGGRLHTLDESLGRMWVANFQPALFQVEADGSLVPRGSPGADDIARVEAVPAV